MAVPARLVLCLAVVVAGCGGAPTEGAGGGETPAATVTPAPVPTERSPTVSRGVDGERLVPLAGRHGAALADRSFTALGRRIVTGPVGVLLDVRWERRVAADRETYHAVREGTETWGWDGRDPVDRRHRYHDGERTVTRDAEGGAVRHGVGSGPGRADLDDADYLAGLVGAFDSWRVRRYPNGSLVLSGRGLERPEAVGVALPLRDARNARVDVRVGPGGAVDSVRIRFEATVDGIPVSVLEERRYVAVGATGTDRPPWYDAALATATTNVTAER